MAKRRRRRKKSSGYEFEYWNVVAALILIVLPILAFGLGKPLGFVGRYFRIFSVLLFGMFDWLFLVGLLLLGLYLLFKKVMPRFLSSKSVGMVIFLIGLFALAHISYAEGNVGFNQIQSATGKDLQVVFDAIQTGSEYTVKGSGVLGGAILSLFTMAFDKTGTTIVSIVFIVLGITVFTGFSIVDVLREGYEKEKENIKQKREEKLKQKELDKNDVVHNPGFNDNKPVKINNNMGSDEEEEKPKLVVSSVDELKKMNDEVKERKEDDIVSLLTEDPPVQKAPDTRKYVLPTLDLLKKPAKKKNDTNTEQIERNIAILEKTLRDFGIIGHVVEVNPGPAVTQYELEVQTGTRLSKLLGINKEISLALAKKDVRIEAPIPGKSTVGIEIPNDEVSPVSLREILQDIPQNKVNSKLLVALGKNIMGKSKFCEIDKTPHLLVAGATGSGKSVCINCIIASILMRTKPDEVKLVMVDPKKVELSNYNGVPHLLMPVVTDPKKASVALQKIVNEMENRYDEFSRKGVKNIAGYNEWVEKENKIRSDEDKIAKMPYYVVIVDELADLMLVASKEVEDSIMRITQMARAAGIHLIIATQRPSVDVITGVVKSNIPSRISFAVSSQIDSRTILDMTGAEKLLGKGDMLFLPMGEGAPERIQGAYVSDEEIQAIIDYTVKQQVAQYDDKWSNLEAAADQGNAGKHAGEDSEDDDDDDLYNDVVEFVITSGKASASLLQRRFKIGYNRAARLVDLLEERGIIGPQNGSKPREVLVKLDDNGSEEE